MSPCSRCGAPDTAPSPTGMCIPCAILVTDEWAQDNPYVKRVAQKAKNATKKKAKP